MFYGTIDIGAQVDAVFLGEDNGRGELIFSDSVYYGIRYSSGYAVFSKRSTHYRQYTSDSILILEGEIAFTCVDCFGMFGLWKEYYRNGNKKCEGSYYKNLPVGNWNRYYENGNLQCSYALTMITSDSVLTICHTGAYNEYYSNGGLKLQGQFEVRNEMAEAYAYKDIEPFEEYIIQRLQPVSLRMGWWIFYTEDGRIEKKVDYSKQSLQKRMITPDTME